MTTRAKCLATCEWGGENDEDGKMRSFSAYQRASLEETAGGEAKEAGGQAEQPKAQGRVFGGEEGKHGEEEGGAEEGHRVVQAQLVCLGEEADLFRVDGKVMMIV